ncbi:MAG: hypothetical protein ACREDR_07195 [Blastocatellia bacterium]
MKNCARYLVGVIRLAIVLGLVGIVAPQCAAAQGADSFGPATLIRTAQGKDVFTETFTLSDPSGPFTLEIHNGTQDGSERIRKGWITLNGQQIAGPTVVGAANYSLIAAIHPQQQNQLVIKAKGGPAGTPITVYVHPTSSTVLNQPGGPGFDAAEAGLGVPYGVAVNSDTHQAYVADRYYGSVFQFDINSASIVRQFSATISGTPLGSGGTTGIRFDPNLGKLAAINEGVNSGDQGSLAVIDLNAESVNVFPLMYSGQTIHAEFVAIDSKDNLAACVALYNGGHYAYLVNLSTGALSQIQSSSSLTSPVFSAVSGQFIFSAQDSSGGPGLLLAGTKAQFKLSGSIKSSAPLGTYFQKMAINAATNVVVAVDQQDSAAYVFDLATNKQTARIPITTGGSAFGAADIAINPKTNMAVITSHFSNLVTVINLQTMLVTLEIPLPPSATPLGVDIDTVLNRAVVSEDSISSNTRNGSVFVLQLPDASN